MPVAVKKSAPELQNDSLRLYRLSVEQYHRMISAGILNVNDRVELLEGQIVTKMARNPPHDSSIARVTRRLVRHVPDDWIVRVQSAITLSASEPEPDFAIARGPEDRYVARHPGPSDIAVLMEVADSSLLDDRRRKGVLYAEARVPEFWLVNLVAHVIEMYTLPRAGKYRRNRQFHGEELIPLFLGGRKVAEFAVKEFVG